MKKYFLLIFILPALFTSCKKEPDPVVPATPNYSGGVFITCEGVFMNGNAALSFYSFGTDEVNADVFSAVNSSPLGDICQSMYLQNGKAYVVVNNSGKVEVIDADHYNRIATISGLQSPRYFLPVDASHAFVTDLFANAVSVIDLQTNTIAYQIPLNGWTEELANVNGKIYVTNESSNYVYLIDPAGTQVSDSISLSYGSNSLRTDANGKVWVLCGGDAFSSVPGALHRINPVTRTVEASFPFPAGQSPWKLRMNPAGDTLYYLNSDVYRMSINDSSLPSTAFITAGSSSFYGLDIDPNTNVIYLADAIDFSQNGIVSRYRPDGTLVNQFHVGIAPGGFGFK